MPWSRRGGETYGASFQIKTDKYIKQFFLKAITTLNPEKSLIDWKKRRNILIKNNIPVSNWYHASSALIIEDYYTNNSKIISFKRILEIGYKLDRLGFSTLKFLDDIMADDYGNPFYVDFGFDLGEPSNNFSNKAKKFIFERFPNRKNEIEEYYDENILN